MSLKSSFTGATPFPSAKELRRKVVTINNEIGIEYNGATPIYERLPTLSAKIIKGKRYKVDIDILARWDPALVPSLFEDVIQYQLYSLDATATGNLIVSIVSKDSSALNTFTTPAIHSEIQGFSWVDGGGSMQITMNLDISIKGFFTCTASGILILGLQPFDPYTMIVEAGSYFDIQEV